MAAKSLNYEDYPAVGDALISSFQTDQAEFLKKYKKMDAAFLTNLKTTVEATRKLSSVFAQNENLKKTTVQLYAFADGLNAQLLFLGDYLKQEKLNFKEVSEIRANFKKRNIEGAIKQLRDFQPYLNQNKTVLEAGNMPLNYLAPLFTNLPQMELLNAEQIKLINQRKTMVEQNGNIFEKADVLFSDICSAGKKIFKDTIKKEEYTLNKILKRVRVSSKPKETEIPPTN